jgi:hypothetical protein
MESLNGAIRFLTVAYLLGTKASVVELFAKSSFLERIVLKRFQNPQTEV